MSFGIHETVKFWKSGKQMLIKNKNDFPGVIFLIGTILTASMSLSNIFFGIVYDTIHIDDTLFMLAAGWRAAQGLSPVLDFGHFYGGFIEEGIGLTMRIFGPSVFAIEKFALIILAGLVISSLIILSRRMSFSGFMALVLILTTLMLTRYPLERYQPIIDMVSAHSFIYNRFGFCVFLISGLFVAIRAPIEKDDILPGALIGILLISTMMTKPTFIVLVIGVVLGLTLQRRWYALAAVIMGFSILSALFDPTFQRWTGALSYGQAHLIDEPGATVSVLILKSILLIYSHLIEFILAAGALSIIIIARTQLASISGLFLVSLAGVGMATTMGTQGHIGQLALPVAILAALAAGEIARISNLTHSISMQMVSYTLVVTLAAPHLVNLAGVTLQGMAQRHQLLISEGPYADYLLIQDGPIQQDRIKQYEMFADGIAALHNLGEPSRWGIIADQGIVFEHAVLGKPVLSYPLWQRLSAPELNFGKPLGADVDIVMISRSRPASEIGTLLRTKLDSHFTLCSRSMHWDIYSRLINDISCSIVR